MAAGATYEPIATTTLSSASSSVIFGSTGIGGAIPSTYTDLIIVANGTTASNSGWGLRFNLDADTYYSTTYIEGSGTSAVSEKYPSSTILRIAWNSLWNSTTPSSNIAHIQNYANTSTFKTVLFRSNSSSYVEEGIGTWRRASAINSIEITTATAGGANFSIGTTFTLYGIKAA